MFVLSLALGFALPQGLPVPQKMPAPGLSRSVDPSLPSLLTDIPEARVSLLYSVDSCLQLAARQNINLILQHYNYTGKLGRRRPQEDKMGLLKVAFITISCLIVVENLLVLIAIVRSLHARRWVYSCIASITVSDLLAGVAYICNICLSGSRTFQLTPELWFLREGVLFIALAASTFSLLVTAIERYSTMVRPIAENEASKTLRLRSLIVSCWALAILIGMLPLLGWNCLCDFPSCSTLLPLYSKNYVLFCVAMFSMILLGIIGLYASIYRLVWASSQQAVTRHSRNRSLRLLKTVLMILGAFILCWSPLFGLLLLDVFCESQTCKPLQGMDWALALALLNSAINPLIYSFRSLEVRRAVLCFVCCCCIRLGLHGPGDCLLMADINSGSSTESSLRTRESLRRTRDSFRRSVVLNARARPREPLSSNSSMMSNLASN
ncbi:sphingosine 1-phosphate receptor 4 [Chrysemys picta bellii]|uniref:sphingosine 1-phosphate receptor 4 n=1 Tax=Chrysemys picta bellii TaxID=8478 RepID=UPI0032B20CB0